MSSFTDNIVVMAVPRPRSGWHRWLPPGFHQPRWELWDGFTYAVGDLRTDIKDVMDRIDHRLESIEGKLDRKADK